MKKFALAFIFALSFITIASAQQTEPLPTPPPAIVDDKNVVKISTALIQIDVTVTDSKGNIVTDLKPEDFEIYENGEKQDITTFSFVSAGKALTKAERREIKEARKDQPEVPVPPREIKPEQVRRTIALVVDDLSLSFESTHFVRRALRNFVEEQMQDGDFVAIIRTGAGIGALQQFTSDKNLLFAAIKKITWNPRGRGGIGAIAPISVAAGDLDPKDNSVDGRKVDEDELRNETYINQTLSAVRYIIKGMDELPGRKSIMLLSDGFSLFSPSAVGNGSNSVILNELRKVVDAANRATVVVHTMDARGLQPLFLTAADDTGSRTIGPPGSGGAVVTSDKIFRANQGRAGDFFDSQGGLVYLAKETGGFSFLNSNDMSVGIRKMLNENSYYLLGYQPDGDTFDADKNRFNKFEIKVKRDDLKVRYRSGFFGVTDEEFRKTEENLTPKQKILDAMYSPFGVNDITLRLNTLFGNDEKQGSFVRSLLHVNTDDLVFKDEGNGRKRLTFDILAASFDTKGVAQNEISKTYDVTLSGEKYERFVKEGFVYFFTFPVKKEGAYQMRVVIRDHASGKVGSASQFIEIPKLKKNRPTLSDLVLENLTIAQWNNEAQRNQQNVQINQNTQQTATNPMRDTSLRTYKQGTILRYAFEIYNPSFSAGQKPQLNMQAKLFYEGKEIFAGNPQPVNLTGQNNLSKIPTIGAINLGTEMNLGEYVLQIVITDELAKDKYKYATQYVPFELVK